MDWASLAQLIIQIGLPAAQYIIKKIEGGAPATSTELAELLVLTNRTATDRAMVVLAAQGIDPASDKGKAILALVQ